ncbi:MAG TPA: sugar phosphate isomerase/epimerase [Planctomycetota bacterium]|nr:sugar phosphate isomerase/epimerase [Planctomycetota bacterium]
MDLHRFAFSTSAYRRLPLKKALKRIAKAGFKGVEIVADKPHFWLDQFSPRDLSRLVKQLEKLDLYVSNVNAISPAGFWGDAPDEPLTEPSLISRNRSLREWRLAYVKKALRAAKELGAHAVTITSGKALSGMPPEKARKLLDEELARLLEVADQLGQRLALQVEPGHLIERTGELEALLDKFATPHLGASLNIGIAEVSGEDVCGLIRKLEQRLFALQMMDIRARKRYSRVPGDGDIDFRAVHQTLENSSYTGPLTWELPHSDLSPDEACVRTFKYVRTLLLEQRLSRPEPGKRSRAGKRKTKAASAISRRSASVAKRK